MILDKIYHEDCQTGLKIIPEESIDAVITSPPYNLSIKYNSYDDSKSRQEYLQWLNKIFSMIRKILKPQGHFFLNVGYSNKDPWLPHDVANECRSMFILQNNITWIKSITIDDSTKGNFKPINSHRYITPTNETIFHFTKNGDAPIDRMAIGVPFEYPENIDKTTRIRGRIVKSMGFENWNKFIKQASPDQHEELQGKLAQKLSEYQPSTHRCRGNSWFIPYTPIKSRKDQRGNHPATFPVKLAEYCIKLSQADIILDPFMGIGTTAVAAKNLNKHYIGFEIDAEYIKYAEQRLKE